MGNNNTKKKRTRRGRLSVCEVSRIVDALDVSSSTDISKGVNADVVQSLWKQELVASLLEQYKHYLFPHPNSKCSVEEFADLYGLLVRGSYEEKACVLAKVIGGKPDCHSIPFALLIKYVADLLESYLTGVEKRKTREYLSWHGRWNGSAKTQNIIAVAKNWCSDMNLIEGQVPLDQLEQWLHSCGVLSCLHREEFGILFNLEPDEEDEIGMLPLLMNPESLGVTHSVLDPAHVLHLNFLLPQDYQREWRFLFSTRSHGESFSMLLGRILDKGPTIIIITDEKDHIFGGFASESWSLSPKFRGDVKCFLFTLQPEVKVFHPTGYNNHYMYLNYHQQSMPNGLGMGGQFNYWGLWLDGEFGHGGCADVCTTFRNYTMLSSSKNFSVRHLEIWAVGPAPLTAEEKGERTGILDKDPTARKILEMAGKAQHSAGIRDEPS